MTRADLALAVAVALASVVGWLIRVLWRLSERVSRLEGRDDER